jgi:hypothetical protein
MYAESLVEQHFPQSPDISHSIADMDVKEGPGYVPYECGPFVLDGFADADAESDDQIEAKDGEVGP